MDGVLVDFDNGYKKMTNGLDIKSFSELHGKDVAKNTFLTAGVKFWAGLDWIQGGREVFDTATKLFKTVKILSSAGTTDPEKGNMVIEGKREWLKKNIPSFPLQDAYIVGGRHLKQSYASKNSILVDDMAETIQQWNAAGGNGILHHASSYKKTIETLEDLSRPIKLTELVKRICR